MMLCRIQHDHLDGRVRCRWCSQRAATNYSVPVAYGSTEHACSRPRATFGDGPVVISCGAEALDICGTKPVKADTTRRGLLSPTTQLHYLPLIEQKIGALDQAAPLAGWDLPEAFITLRRLLEARMGKAGKREYVQVLRLLETFRLEEVEGAVGDALRLGAIGFDAVKHLVLCRIERRPPRLNLDVYPYLPRARVAMTSAKSYMSLLSGLGA